MYTTFSDFVISIEVFKTHNNAEEDGLYLTKEDVIDCRGRQKAVNMTLTG